MASERSTGTRAERAAFKGHRLFAALYDPMNRGLERTWGAAQRRALLASLRGRVLDIGIGTGANLPYYPPETTVVGIEPDPHMLRRAQAKLAAGGRTSVEFRQAPAEALPFADASFDHVVCTLVLCTVHEPDRALAEIRRVLKPEGEVYFLEHVRPDGGKGRLLDIVRPVWSAMSAGCIVNRRTGQLLERAGFHIDALETQQMRGLPVIIGHARLASPR